MDIPPKEKLELAKKHRFRSLKLLEVDWDQELGNKPFGAIHGKLDNGLTYYVRSNPKPQNRAALALAVNIGSVVEEEIERGVAHIVEHLAFSATKSYTNHDIVKFLESIGFLELILVLVEMHIQALMKQFMSCLFQLTTLNY